MAEPGPSCGPLVLVYQPAEDLAASYPRRRQVSARGCDDVVSVRWPQVPGPVRTLTGPVPEPGGPVPQVQQQIPGLLRRPRAIRVRGHAQDVNMAGAHLDREEDIDAAQGDRAVDVEEVAGQHRGGLGAQELLPG